MTRLFLRSLLATAFVAALSWQLSAQEPPAAKNAETTITEGKPAGEKAADTDVVKPADIPKLIRQLDSDVFAERQEASAKLQAAGDMAIPALEKATQSDSRETSMRAFEILRTHFEKGGPTLRDASKQALERVAKTEEGIASRRAKEILTPPTPVAPNPAVRIARAPIILPAGGFAPAPAPGFAPAPGIAPVPGGIRVFGGARIVIGAAGGGGIETKIKVENGVKTTEIKDKDRQVKIVDDPDKGLQLEVTETKDGKEKTEKYETKNADELKTKHPEAHKIYEEYNAKAGDIKIGGFAPGGVPVPGMMPGADRLEEMKKRSEQMRKDAEQRMEDSRKRIEELRKDSDKRFEDSQKRMEELRKDSEKRLEDSQKRSEEIRKEMQKDLEKRIEEARKQLEELEKGAK